MKLAQRLGLCWRILRARPGNLLDHANRELPPDDSDEMQGLMNQGLRELLLVFSTQGHSGFSAQFAQHQLNLLLDFKPLGPLTGEPSEWCELDYGDDMAAQNKRCGRVFKRKDGTAYDSQGRVFREPDGSCYTNGESRVDITFPYTPTVEYVDRPAT
jgi:hypothetical protein